MNRRSSISLILSLLLLWSNPVAANYQFTHFDMEDGLSQNTVFAIVQDHLGFMWFGTKNGLNRYDGHSFRTYYRGTDEHSLKNDYINTLAESSDRHLWVGTDNGLFIYNHQYDSFEEFNGKTADGISIKGNIVNLVSWGDYMYVAAQQQGLFRYDVKTRELIFKPYESYTAVICMSMDSDGNLWVGHYGGEIYKGDKDLANFQLLTDSDGNSYFKNSTITGIVNVEQGQLFVGTGNKGVNIIDTNKKELIHLMPETGTKGSYVHDMLKISNEIWAATENGIYVYELLAHKVKHYAYEPTNPFCISDNPVQTLSCDRNGGVWIGTYFGGVNYCSQKTSNFEYVYPRIDKEQTLHGRRVREFAEDKYGIVWIGTEDGGLHYYNPETKVISHISESSQFSNIHGLCVADDKIWIGTFSFGLKVMDLKTKKIIRTFLADGSEGSLKDNDVFAIAGTKDGIYVGTLSGVARYDNGRFHYVDELPSAIIYDIHEDIDGNLWVATYGKGVYMRPAGSAKWQEFNTGNGAVRSDNILSISETSKGTIWITTEGGGMYRYIGGGKLDYITVIQGVTHKIVFNMVEDQSGKLWFTTNMGMVCYDPNTRIPQVYTTDNGLLSNNFNYKSLLCSKSGRIYAGSLNGFISFLPESLHKADNNPNIVATELYINNTIVDNLAEDSPLSQSITMTDKLVLEHGDNSIMLKMAAMVYNTSHQVQLVYKLEGFDDEWQSLQSNYFIRYTNLPTGNYKLLVKASDNSETPYILSITIKPEWYLSWWAWVLYVLTAVALIVLLWQFFKRRSAAHRRLSIEKFEREKDQELYKSKITFFTNVAHEIRTPLTLIKMPLENLLKQKLRNATVREDLSIMEKNVNRLLDLTNQLLDFRKAERNGMKLTFERSNINNIVEGVYVRFASVVREKGVKMDISMPDEPVFAYVDKESVTKIVSNLINNAVKYCEKTIFVELLQEDNCFKIMLKNDGELIPAANREDIFAAFVRGDNATNISGTGIGLALARSIAELHSGTLDIVDDSELNVFCLTMPLMQAEKIGIDDKDTVETGEAVMDETNDETAPVILIVEDNSSMLMYEKQKLQPYYNVLTASNGEEALAIVKKHDVDVIVSDCMMEPMDGLHLCRHIKNDVKTSHIPFILLTALTLDSAKVEAMERGADAYIEKPFSMEYLLSTIKNMLRIRQSVKDAYALSPFTSSESVAVNKRDSEFIRKVEDIVKRNINNNDFSIRDLAEEMGLSRTALNRKVNGVMGMTPNSYIKVVRLKKAAELMKEGGYNVTEVAYKVGFTSSSYFAQCFYKQFGVQPKEFINSVE